MRASRPYCRGRIRGHDPADPRWETGDLRARDRDRIGFARTMGPGTSGEHDPLGWLCFHDHYRKHAGRQPPPHAGRGCRDAGGLSTSGAVWPRSVVASSTGLKKTEISAKTLTAF